MQISVRTRANDLVDSLERTDGKMQPESKQHDSFVDTAGRAAMNMVKKKRNKTKTSAVILRVSTETEQLKHNQKQKQTQVWDNDLLAGKSPLEPNPVYVMAAAEVQKGPSVSPPIICVLNRDLQQGAK